ncbi:hypothetical protein [Salinibacterium sp. GXW1014]|uniref:hypothetical protein n=1 Tax=Salinibacterium sp. GXW1014 TaxID=3377838 RepID=UPI00383A2687
MSTRAISSDAPRTPSIPTTSEGLVGVFPETAATPPTMRQVLSIAPPTMVRVLSWDCTGVPLAPSRRVGCAWRSMLAAANENYSVAR